MKTALVLGASGLVGGYLTRQLLEDPRYSQVRVLVRRPLALEHPKLLQEIYDFENRNYDLVQGNDLFCALGTTLRKAGSKLGRYEVDSVYPFELAKIAKLRDVRQYLLVSSVGADVNSNSFYLHTKGELEDMIKKIGFQTFISVRPSILLDKRSEFRLGERIGIRLVKLLEPLLTGKWLKYRGIQAEQVARAMIALANQGLTGVHIVESDQLQTIGESAG